MAITVISDQVVDLTEESGVITSMSRKYLVTGITGSDWTNLTDALDAASVPVVNDAAGANTNLVVLNRRVESIPGSPSKAYVTIEYVDYARSLNNFVPVGESSLKQLQTQNDAYGNQIIVEHDTIQQGGEVSVFAPDPVLRLTGVLFTDYPQVTVATWVNHVNWFGWNGGAAGTWLCTNVSYEPMDISQSPKWWRFTFSFQYDALGWNPQAVYIDPQTGKPPADIVAGVGIVNVEWYPTHLFNAQFPL